MITRIGTYVITYDSEQNMYRIRFAYKGRTVESPWLGSRALCLRWAGKVWEPEHA